MNNRTISHYRIIRPLAVHTHAEVHLAEDLETGDRVALKLFPAGSAADPALLERVESCARLARELVHPNIVRCLDHGAAGDQIFIVLEHLDGTTLAERLKSGPLSIEGAVALALQLAVALDRIHSRGLVHRDLKSSNVMLCSDGNARLLDLDLLERAEAERPGPAAILSGTPAAFSPEQARGRPLDGRTDIWSLGVLLYEALTGRRPFSGRKPVDVLYQILHEAPTEPSRWNRAIPPRLEAVVLKCLEKDAADRYASAAGLASDLRALAPVPVDGVVRQPSAALWAIPEARRRRRVLAGVAMAAGLALALALVGWMTRGAVSRAHGDARNGWFSTPSGERVAAVAFLGFSPADTTRTDDACLATSLDWAVEENLVAPPCLRLLNRRYVQDVRRRVLKVPPGWLDRRVAVDVARTAGAACLVHGVVDHAGAAHRAEWEVVDAGNGRRPSHGRESDGDARALEARVVKGLLVTLGRRMGRASGLQDHVVTLPAWSADVLAHYEAGQTAYWAGRRGDAVQEFKAATAIDSTFALGWFGLSQSLTSLWEIREARAVAERAWRLRSHLSVRERLRLEAWKAWINGQDPEADAIHRELLERWPDDWNSLYDRGHHLFALGFFPEAESALATGVRFFPEDQDMKDMLTECRLCMGEIPDPVTTYLEYMQRFPEDAWAWNFLAGAWLSAGNPDSAETCYRRQLQLNADSTSAILGLATCRWNRGDAEAAVAMLRGYMNRLSGDRQLEQVNAAGKVVDILDGSGRFAEARRTAEDVLRRTKRGFPNVEAEQILANTLVHSGRYREILARYPLKPEGSGLAAWRATYFRGAVLAELGRLAEAREALRVLEGYPEWHAVRRKLCLLLRLKLAHAEGDAGNARKALTALRDRNSWQCREWSARVLALEGKLPEAVVELRNLLTARPGDFRLHYELGLLYERLGQPADAAASYRAFLAGWSKADPGLARVADARRRLAGLVGRASQSAGPLSSAGAPSF